MSDIILGATCYQMELRFNLGYGSPPRFGPDDAMADHSGNSGKHDLQTRPQSSRLYGAGVGAARDATFRSSVPDDRIDRGPIPNRSK